MSAESPAGTGPASRSSGLRITAWSSFAGLAIFLAVIGTLYAVTADDEPAGGILLFGASSLAGVVAVFVWWATRKAEAEGLAEEHPRDDETPTPLYVGAGMALTVVGFIVGPFVLAPGIVILFLAIVLAITARR